MAVVIKKYGNRRLYDTASSRYVNLEDIAALVRAGEDVKVVDAKTGEDLTRVTLTQIILEDTKEQPSGLPLELLRQLIVTTDQVGREFMTWYLRSAFSAYKKVEDTVQSGLRSAALSPLEMMRSLMASPADDEVERLRRRVAELEARSGRAKRGRRGKPKGKK